MAEIVLNGACVVAVICQLEPGSMAKHVRMNGKGHLRAIPSSGDHLPDSRRSQWSFAFTHEYESRLRVPFSKAPQATAFVLPQRMIG
jgi:hypothetical protein